ncbi:MAG: putative secreted protein with C-terminal beta-propeller domain [Lentisphaeria bacterium]|jgi:uncharacterized secreted protein with C-terminal beta-propeller domain
MKDLSQTVSKTLKTALLFFAGSTIVACGGEGNNTGDPIVNPDTGGTPTGLSISEYNKLELSAIEPVVLKQATAQELETHLKNGLRLNVYITRDTIGVIGAPAVRIALSDASAAPEAAAADAATSDNFSETNTQVAGVDESDFIKYDGQFLYMTNQFNNWWEDDAAQNRIRILETNPDTATIEEVGSVSISNDQWGNVGELYLVHDETDNATKAMATIRSSWTYYATIEPRFDDVMFASWPYYGENQVQITSYDVTDPTTPSQNYSVEIDGFLQGSRKIGNTLYLVTQYSPYIPYIDYVFDSDEAAQTNEAQIASLTLDDLLPGVGINGGDKTPLVQAEDCYLPVDVQANQGYHNIVTLVAIDLDSQNITSTQCLNAQVSGIYSSTNNLYIGASSDAPWADLDSFTVVHKFSLADNVISYRATGSVAGTIGWSNPAYRMDEYQDTFRIVSTTRDESGQPVHHLSILRDSDSSDEMTTLAQLPNEAHPETIGKPQEDIFAVRFMEDRAYVVTFLNIDPLYVFDLSDAEDPFIAGELEVPGVSTYLHPVGDNTLLGLGYENNFSGLSVNLYDVNDISAPTLIGSDTVGEQGSWTAALYDSRAISFMQASDDQLRFTLPVSRYSDNWQWQDEALHLFEVNGLAANNAELIRVGSIISESSEQETPWPTYSGNDRSIMHNEAVYYTHGNDVWASFWSSPNAATGPH